MPVKFPQLINADANISEKVILEGPVRIGAARVESCAIGKWTYIGGGSRVGSHTKIGAYCSIGQNVVIAPAVHPMEYVSTHPFQYDVKLFAGIPGYGKVRNSGRVRKPATTIGNDVWISQGATIIAGITIGSGAVIGAAAVVTKDVAPYSKVAGVPARVIGERFDDTVAARFLATEWWLWDPVELEGVQWSLGEKALPDLEARVSELKSRSA